MFNLFRYHRAADPIPAVQPVLQPLKGFQILLIICALLFLSLLLLGLGCSYACLKRRNVRVIHRQPFGSGTGSEITKLSGSSLGNISMFEGLKIPRAHAFLHAAPSSSGSEANLVIDHSDTLPSDYPSESHSEVGIEASNSNATILLLLRFFFQSQVPESRTHSMTFYLSFMNP